MENCEAMAMRFRHLLCGHRIGHRLLDNGQITCAAKAAEAGGQSRVPVNFDGLPAFPTDKVRTNDAEWRIIKRSRIHLFLEFSCLQPGDPNLTGLDPSEAKGIPQPYFVFSEELSMYHTRILNETERTITLVILPVFVIRQIFRNAAFNRRDDFGNKRQVLLVFHMSCL